MLTGEQNFNVKALSTGIRFFDKLKVSSMGQSIDLTKKRKVVASCLYSKIFVREVVLLQTMKLPTTAAK